MMGDILYGNRTYFPLPVAYANNRSPVIPAELGRPVPIAAASGMGSFFDETSVTDAIGAPATILGLPLVGIALVLGLGMLWASRKKGPVLAPAKKSRKRRK